MPKAETVTYQAMYKYVSRRKAMRRSFFSLPFTMVFWCIFIVVGWKHGNVHDAYRLKSSVRDFLDSITVRSPGASASLLLDPEGEGPPININTVNSPEDVMKWLQFGCIPMLWKHKIGKTLWLRNTNKVVGGIRVSQKRLKPRSCPDVSMRAFYDDRKCHSEEDSDPFGDHPSTYGFYVNGDENKYSYWIEAHLAVEAAQAFVEYYVARRWLGPPTSSLIFEIPLYNSEIRSFSLTQIEYSFERSGHPELEVKTWTAASQLYQTSTQVVVDMLWISMLLFFAAYDIHHLRVAARKGRFCAELTEFYMIVEWCIIFFGLGVGAFWLALIPFTTSLRESIASLPLYDFPSWTPTSHPLPAHLAVLDEAVRNLKLIVNLQESHQVVMFGYTFIIMLRFINAFEGQPRLEIIRKTLMHASVDIIHFLIIFAIIFFNFALGGFILFGNSIAEWNDYQAITTAFRALMGDFDYDAMSESHPIAAILWFWSYMILIFLILLNMFLAIVVDAYGEVKRSADGDASTLWSQGVELYGEILTNGFTGVDQWSLMKRAFAPPKEPSNEKGSRSVAQRIQSSGSKAILNVSPMVAQTRQRMMIKWTEESVNADYLCKQFKLRHAQADKIIGDILEAERRVLQDSLDPMQVLEEKFSDISEFMKNELQSIASQMQSMQHEMRREHDKSHERRQQELHASLECMKNQQAQLIRESQLRRRTSVFLPAALSPGCKNDSEMASPLLGSPTSEGLNYTFRSQKLDALQKSSSMSPTATRSR
eukprot:GEMP01003635.1.p1 GENE.GEMP01003635.1~~GEMP01003635.1.p1  ORF type:complete len:895 (+),score=165.95 GEMP01003635.1:396-2687(+)